MTPLARPVCRWHGFGQAAIGEGLDIGKGHVRQRLRRGAGVGAGHVGDAIVEDVLLDKNGIVVGGGARGFRAAALVDGDVDEDAAGFHRAQHGARDEPRRLRAGHEHRADEQIDRGQQFRRCASLE